MKKELVCNLCLNCINDCKVKESLSNCEHFKKGYNRFEYNKMIHEQNVNLKKMCKMYGLKYYCLLNMLKSKQHFTYKYRMVLNEVLHEREEFLPYIDKWEGENE